MVLKLLKLVEDDLDELVTEFDHSKVGKCHTFSNLMASYLYVHFDKTFKQVGLDSHSWVASPYVVVDITRPSPKKVFLSGTDEFDSYKTLEHKLDVEDYPLFAKEEASRVMEPFSSESLINFIKCNFREIDELIVNNGFYR